MTLKIVDFNDPATRERLRISHEIMWAHAYNHAWREYYARERIARTVAAAREIIQDWTVSPALEEKINAEVEQERPQGGQEEIDARRNEEV